MPRAAAAAQAGRPLLVLMLNLYTYNNIDEMMRIYGLFQRSMEENQTLTPQ